MSAIVPRWEWRAFGERFGAAEERFVALSPESATESDELYLLSGADDGDTVKVRAELMDVKRLVEVNADGLEQWVPVLKAAFPLSPDDVGTVCEALRVPSPALTRQQTSLDELLAELGASDGGLRPVQVHKRRLRTTIDGCLAELAEVLADGVPTRTIALESEDPELVIATVRALGLDGRRNVSYPRGLRALLGLDAQRFAVIDIGTNSVKLHLAERDPHGDWTTLVDRAEVTRLGEGLADGGRLAAPAIARTVDAVAGMVDEARRAGVVEIAAVGTAWMRIASNAAVLADEARSRCGLTVEAVSGDEESRLAYLATERGLGLAGGALVVFDTGGGSSQFTFGHDGAVDERFSVNVGAARFTDRFGLDGAVGDDVLAAALDAIAAELVRLDGRPSPDALVGMGGAITNITAVKHGLAAYDPDVVQGTVLDLAEIDRQIELYRTRSAEERRAIVGLQPKRAEVILAGACIVRTVMTKLGRDSLTVSDRGLRHGLLVERFGHRPTASR